MVQSCTFDQSTPQVVSFATLFGGILIDPACQDYVYLSNTSQGQIEVYSLQTLTLGTPIPVGAAPMGLDMTPDGTLLLHWPTAANTPGLRRRSRHSHRTSQD